MIARQNEEAQGAGRPATLQPLAHSRPMTNSSTNHSSFRKDINGLRAWAVIAVVLYHFSVPGFTGGFVGVDIFFVISGFLMTRIISEGLGKRRFSLRRFYAARARRIIPALTGLCATLMAAGWFLLPALEYRHLAKHAAGSLLFLSNFLLRNETGYFDIDSHEKWLLHTWSLSVEWQFYLVLPLILLAIWKLRPSKTLLTTTVALGFIGSLALSITLTPNQPSTAFYLLPTRAWELFAGGLLCLLFTRPVANGKLLELGGFALIIGSIVLFDSATPWPGYWALVPVTGTMMVLIASRSDSIWTGTRLAQWFGDTSYSIYLWHWPVAVALLYIQRHEQPVAVLIGLGLSLLLGYASFRFIESPTRRPALSKKIALRPLGLAAATIMVLLLALTVRFNDGLPHRLPHVEAIAQEAVNQNPRRDDCHIKRGVQSPSCVYGGSDLAAIVVGDSHAASVVRAVEAALPSPRLSVMEWTYSSCPTLLGAKRHPDSHSADSQCGQFNEWVRTKLEAAPQHIPVIIVNRTSSYALGPNEARRADERRPEVYFSRPYDVPSPEFLEEYAAHLIDSACEFAKSRDVYLVRPIPEMRIDVPRAMSRAAIFGQELRISVSLDEYQARHDLAWAAQDEASRKCGVKILNPLPYLCQGERCWGDLEGRPLYTDDDHLSEFGNRLLVPMFKQVFERLDHPIAATPLH